MTVAFVKNRVNIPNFRDGKWKKMGNRADIRRLNLQVWNIVLADETATNFQKNSSHSRPDRGKCSHPQLQSSINQIVTQG